MPGIAVPKEALQTKLYRLIFWRTQEKLDSYSNDLLGKAEPNRGPVFKTKMCLVGKLSDGEGLC